MADPGDIIVKGKRIGDPKAANIIDVMPGTAPKIKLRAGDVVQIGKEGMRFEPGEYIILPLEQWARTLSRAVANSAPVELETHQPKKKRSN